MFASKVRKQIAVPDGDQTVTVIIRKLSGQSLEKAAEIRAGFIASYSAKMGAEMIKAFAVTDGDKAKVEPTLDERRKARYTQYDRDAVLTAGIVSWDAKDEKGKPLSMIEGMKDLDEETRELLHNEILDLSLPPIDPKEAEEREGNA